ncbi:TVP38/TMEM64 family protein [Paenibacillus mesotrionivorans]|uniref:TVP38/TMEM64 family protein n=1 Tax=Paenibacillus mesotrionivorans TaxID=3160968 RepID=A0ACC7P174_9BACL
MAEKRITLKRVFHVISMAGLLLTVILVVYGWHTGMLTSLDMLKSTVHKTGAWGPAVFVLLQIVQVVIPILPGGISLLAGVMIFGPVAGFVYNYLGIAVGSVIAFLLARRLGGAFLQSVSSQKVYDTCIRWLDKKNRFEPFFVLAILLPVAPDDLLCMVAGLTKMKLEKFTMIILLCKPFSIAAYSFGISSFTTWIATAV